MGVTRKKTLLAFSQPLTLSGRYLGFGTFNLFSAGGSFSEVDSPDEDYSLQLRPRLHEPPFKPRSLAARHRLIAALLRSGRQDRPANLSFNRRAEEVSPDPVAGLGVLGQGCPSGFPSARP